jgi:hypothetical protein
MLDVRFPDTSVQNRGEGVGRTVESGGVFFSRWEVKANMAASLPFSTTPRTVMSLHGAIMVTCHDDKAELYQPGLLCEIPANRSAMVTALGGAVTFMLVEQ